MVTCCVTFLCPDVGKAKLGFGCCAKPLNKLVPKLREELQELNVRRPARPRRGTHSIPSRRDVSISALRPRRTAQELIHKEQLAVHRALQTTHQVCCSLLAVAGTWHAYTAQPRTCCTVPHKSSGLGRRPS